MKILTSATLKSQTSVLYPHLKGLFIFLAIRQPRNQMIDSLILKMSQFDSDLKDDLTGRQEYREDTGSRL